MTTAQKQKTCPPGCRPGLTLVELLTVMLLGTILISMALLIYITTSRSYMRQDSLVEQMLNLRSSMAFISRDVRMSGSGFSLLKAAQKNRILVYTKKPDGTADKWFQHDPVDAPTEYGVRPLWFKGNDAGPDTVSISYLAPEFSAPLGRLDSNFSAGDTVLRLNDSTTIEIPSAVDPREVLNPGDSVAIVGSQGAIVLEATSNGSDLSQIHVIASPGNIPSEFGQFTTGAPVYNIRRVHVHTFRVDTATNSLLMDTLDDTGELLAEGIEDLQVGFAVSEKDPYLEADLIQSFEDFNDPDFENNLRLARIILVSKSLSRDPYNNSYPRMTALNHKPTGEDYYPRRALESLVSLRNY
jgi:hypothetical protein